MEVFKRILSHDSDNEIYFDLLKDTMVQLQEELEPEQYVECMTMFQRQTMVARHQLLRAKNAAGNIGNVRLLENLEIDLRQFWRHVYFNDNCLLKKALHVRLKKPRFVFGQQKKPLWTDSRGILEQYKKMILSALKETRYL
uniref:Uncharacterized protein n=1 Tax=Steinernema glaseri TaxID=37863 RepID=A0A1I7YXC6_9BILA